MSRDKRSPIKHRPLRNPGQSVDERLTDVLGDKFLFPFLVSVIAVTLAALEWWRYFVPKPPAPRAYSIMAALVLIWARVRFYRAWPEIKQLRLARRGEIAVGQYLERLREGGYQVFHDVLGDGFNLDHVLIGPTGIYTVETKTWRKRPDSRVVFDGESIMADGFAPDRNPVVQARAQVHWLKQFLTESTGKIFPVRPVIVIPGWFVEQRDGPAGRSTREIWVLEPKALPAFLKHEPQTVVPEDVKLAGYHLSRFIHTATHQFHS